MQLRRQCEKVVAVGADAVQQNDQLARRSARGGQEPRAVNGLIFGALILGVLIFGHGRLILSLGLAHVLARRFPADLVAATIVTPS